ncbi:sulfotransferase [Roseivivax sp. THAF30]|uniref:sulfotransferase n=1 Tax=Roseivivax sp. THAF30 TaxID=2587852 RepID=UPI0012685685|nr:sulfotransferase [Roseivivax sp. THAF30]QFT61371.1 hypothetical protein FIU91_00410 [Roseivivax sp. THAF30]
MRAQPQPEFASVAFPKTARMVFVIGAQKAGTTFLHKAFGKSAEVFLPNVKELHYFDIRRGVGKLAFAARCREVSRAAEALATNGPSPDRCARLRRATDLVGMQNSEPLGATGPSRHSAYTTYLLQGWQGEPLIADVTPAYAILPARDFADMAAFTDARFIFILRDPVSRMWSQLRMAAQVEAGTAASSEAILALARAKAESLIATGRLPKVERADYARTFGNLDQAVAPDRLHVMFYEEMVSSPAPIHALSEFLGIDRIDPDLSRRVNEGIPIAIPPDLDHAFREAFAPQYAFVRERFGARVPDAWRSVAAVTNEEPSADTPPLTA